MKIKTKLLYGLGVNDASYPVEKYELFEGRWKRVWRCPFYAKWSNMLKRCYSKPFLIKNPAYLGCSVTPEWHRFMNFKLWMEKQDWEDKHLDKDILFPGNKVYGPDTCAFVTIQVNLFTTERKNSRGELPIGVSFYKRLGKFVAKCSNGSRENILNLGYFETPEDAHQAWLDKKIELAYALASQQSDPRVAAALIGRYENYQEVIK